MSLPITKDFLGRSFKEVVLAPNENVIARFPATRKVGRKQGTGIAEGEPKAKVLTTHIIFPF